MEQTGDGFSGILSSLSALQEIAEYLGMHDASISRIVGQVEREMLKYKT